MVGAVRADGQHRAADQTGPKRVRQRVHNICEEGFKNSTPIFVDAEESWIQQAIDDLVNENKEKFNKDSEM